MTYDLSTLSPTEQIAALYVAYFGRAPDPEGLTFWETQHAASLNAGKTTGEVIADIADSFSKQVETKSLYPFLWD